MFVKIARITEGTIAELALERLVAGMRPDVDLQSVFPRVDPAAVDARVTILGPAHATYESLNVRGVHIVRHECRGRPATGCYPVPLLHVRLEGRVTLSQILDRYYLLLRHIWRGLIRRGRDLNRRGAWRRSCQG